MPNTSKKLRHVTSLMDLDRLANEDPDYQMILEQSARNFGMPQGQDPYRWLLLNASETEDQEGGGEDGVVEEVNSWIDMHNRQ